jgi:TolA-binding protein
MKKAKNDISLGLKNNKYNWVKSRIFSFINSSKLFTAALGMGMCMSVPVFSQVVQPEYKYGSGIAVEGEVYYEQGLIKLAERELLGLTARFPETPARDKSYILLADIDIKAGNFNVAKQKLTEFIIERPNSPLIALAAVKRAFISYEQGKWQEAEADFEKAAHIADNEFLERGDENYSDIRCKALYWRANAFVNLRNYDAAEKSYEKCINSCKNSDVADNSIFSIAMIKEIAEDYDEAIKQYRRLIKEYPYSDYYVISRIHETNCNLIQKKPAAAMMVLENLESVWKHVNAKDQTGLKFEEQKYVGNVNEKILYLKGESANIAGNFSQAHKTFEQFLIEYSNSSLQNAVRLSTGYALLNMKQYDKALAYYDDVINSDFEDNKYGEKERARLFRAVTLKRIGQTEDARRELMALAAQPTYSYSAAALLELGQLYYEKGDFSASRRTLERAKSEAKNPMEKERIQLLLASSYTQLKLWNLAATEYKFAKKLANETSELFMPDKNLYIAESSLGRGIALVQSKRGAEAIAELNQFLSTKYADGREDQTLFWLAEAYYSGGLLANAINNYRKVVDGYPSSKRREEALYALGWCYFKQKQFALSSRMFERLTREFPQSKFAVEVWTRQGDAYYVQKQFDRAAMAYKRAANLAPKTKEGQYAAFQECDALYHQQSYEAAISALLGFVSRYSKSDYAPNALYLIGWIRFKQEKYQEAIDNFNFMIASHPESSLVPRAHYAIADAYYNAGQYENAISAYKLLEQNHPESPLAPEAVKGVQYCLMALGREDEAIQVIDEYVAKNLESPFIEDFEFKKGDLYYQSGKYTDAVDEYSNFLKKYPDSEKAAEVFFYMGQSNVRLNKLDDAFKIYKKIAIEYPETEYAANALVEAGKIKIEQTKIVEADSIFVGVERNYKGYSAEAEAGFQRAMIAGDMQDTLKSIALYKRVAQLDSTNKFSMQSRFRLARYYKNNGDNDSARYQLSFLTNIAEAPYLAAEAQYRIGSLYMRDGQYELAVDAFVELSEKFPGIDDWYSYGLLGLGESYQKLNLLEKAVEVYKTLNEWRPDDDFGDAARKRNARLEKILIPERFRDKEEVDEGVPTGDTTPENEEGGLNNENQENQ